MKKIRVTAGTIGFYNSQHAHVTKTANDAPFECEDKQAAYFVAQGVAAYVTAAAEAQDDDSQEPETVAGHLDAAQLEAMDYNELKKLAADMGVTPAGQKKADYIAALVAAEVEVSDEESDDELPELDVVDPE